jgi:hypothetical protein
MRAPDDKRTAAAARQRRWQPCPRCGGTGLLIEVDPAVLVATIAAAVGDRAFSARELVAHARVVGGPVAVALGGLSARRLGKKLRKLAGQEFDGLVVEHLGADRDGAIWVVRVVDTHAVTG